MKLYKGGNTLVASKAVNAPTTSWDFEKYFDRSDTSKNFTSATYYFTVQAVTDADKKLNSPESPMSQGQEFTGYSYENVDENDYSWDGDTQTLTIKTNDGSDGWRTDNKILGKTITSNSFKLIKRVIINDGVMEIKDNSLQNCVNLEEVIFMGGKAPTFGKAWNDNVSPTAIYQVPAGVSGYDVAIPQRQEFECIIYIPRLVENGETKDAGISFTAYGFGNNAPDTPYSFITAWQLDDGTINKVDPAKNFLSGVPVKLHDGFHPNYPVQHVLKIKYILNNGTEGMQEFHFKTIPETWENPPPFVPTLQYTITSSADEGGTITPLGAQKVDGGENAAYQITPEKGYVVKDVMVDDKSVGALTEYVFENVWANHKIHVSFEKEEDPAKPDNPEKPDKPVKPDKPDKPAKPDNPGDGEKDDKTTPQTGDDNHIALWLILAATAGGTATVTFRRRRRQEK